VLWYSAVRPDSVASRVPHMLWYSAVRPVSVASRVLHVLWYCAVQPDSVASRVRVVSPYATVAQHVPLRRWARRAAGGAHDRGAGEPWV